MKKNKMMLAALAALASTQAVALERSHDGTGEAILIPYYHAADGEATLFGVTNHTDEAKAVRVVIAEGHNGRVALAFNVYLGPRDRWNAALVGDPNGGMPRIVSNEESCTAPQIAAAGEPLRFAGYTGSRDDGHGILPARAATGAIEMIEVGVPTGAAAALIAQRGCAELTERLVSGVWNANPNQDIGTPSGGLSGQAQIIDVASGVAWSMDPVVFDDFSHAPRHDWAGRPNTEAFKAVRIYKPTVAAGSYFDIGRAGQVAGDHPEDAVSLLLMASSFDAGFALGGGVDAETRLAVSFPTRAAYVDNRPGGELATAEAVRAPFTGAWGDAGYCLDSEWRSIDVAGESAQEQTIELCRQVGRISLGGEEANTLRVDPGLEEGMLSIGLQPSQHVLDYYAQTENGVTEAESHGLPVLVTVLTKAYNANAEPGLLATYGLSQRVTYRREHSHGF